MTLQQANNNFVDRLEIVTDAVFPADIKHSMKFVSLNVTFHSFPIGY